VRIAVLCGVVARAPAEPDVESDAGAGAGAGEAGSEEDPDRIGDAVFETETWPGEGIPVLGAPGPSIPLRDEPRRISPVVQTLASNPPGTTLAFDSTRYVTVTPGIAVALGPDTIRGRMLGARRYLSRDEYHSSVFREGSWPVAAGDSVELLQYRGEGTCFLRVGAEVVDADPCLPVVGGRFEILSEPVVDWWARIQPGQGREGWAVVDDSTVVARTSAGRA
jgi:hypothetical protein